MKLKYDQSSEKRISDLLTENGWASEIKWDKNDWYIEWTEKGRKILNRLPSILNYWYDISDSDKIVWSS